MNPIVLDAFLDEMTKLAQSSMPEAEPASGLRRAGGAAAVGAGLGAGGAALVNRSRQAAWNKSSNLFGRLVNQPPKMARSGKAALIGAGLGAAAIGARHLAKKRNTAPSPQGYEEYGAMGY